MKLKTRTNQPVYYKLPVSSNIQSLSDDLLNSLRVGDVVQKKTGNQKHCYIVTYKEEKHGICLSYFDGSGYMETVSYDYVEGHWVYNSKDVTQVPSDAHIKDVIEGVVSGTVSNVLGLNSNGDLVKGNIFSGDVEVADFGSSPFIHPSRLPTATGTYRLILDNVVVGIMCFEYNTTTFNASYLYKGKYYIVANQSMNNTFELANYPLSVGTKLYRHEVVCQDLNLSNTQIVIISTDKNAYTNASFNWDNYLSTLVKIVSIYSVNGACWYTTSGGVGMSVELIYKTSDVYTKSLALYNSSRFVSDTVSEL